MEVSIFLSEFAHQYLNLQHAFQTLYRCQQNVLRTLLHFLIELPERNWLQFSQLGMDLQKNFQNVSHPKDAYGY